MKIFVLLLIVSFGIISCVPKSDLEKKEQEIIELKAYINELEGKLEKQKKQQMICNDDFALEKLKSYLSFYAPKCKFKDFKVRVVGTCIYDISMNKYHNSGSIIGVIVRIKFNDDGTYNISNIDNDPTWACN